MENVFSGIEEVERGDGTIIVSVGYKPKYEIVIYPGSNCGPNCKLELVDAGNQVVLSHKTARKTSKQMRIDLRELLTAKNPGSVIKEIFGDASGNPGAAY